MLFDLSSLVLLTMLGAVPSFVTPRVVAQADAAQMGVNPALISHAASEQLIAEAPIWGADSGSNGYAFLRVTIHGHQGTLVIDLNCTECDVALSTAALGTIGVTLANADVTTLDALTIGPDTQRAVPLRVIQKPTWHVHGPDSLPPVVGTVGVHFLTTHYDILYDFPHRLVRLYAVPVKPVTSKAAWLPPGFTSADCGKMVHIPPGAATFTGVEMKIDGRPVTGALEMGPYYPKMNERALRALGVPAELPKVHVTDPTPIYGDHVLIANVDGVKMMVGTHTFGAWDTQVLREVDVQTLLPPNTPVMLMNLTMLQDVAVFNATSSNQVCFAKQ